MFRNVLDNPVLLIVLVLIIVVVFGANKLPGAARSLGRSLRIFKSEVRQMHDDDDTTPSSSAGDAPIEGRIVDEPTKSQSRKSQHDA
ncbi:MAG: Sec-independent protein translocase subunit TatA [Actinomycetales bacterium]